ncbi:MAG: hypothetical protein LBC85_10760 [Fibromonadaceae bacterium]|jgi:hypothetical protein|nr:hypothetical protein [Fibromonadaceae bacterium]
MAIVYDINIKDNVSSVVEKINRDLEILNQNFIGVDVQANIFCESLYKISELSKAEVKEFDEAMKKKAEAMKSLADLDKEMRDINLEEQRANMEELYDLQVEYGEKELELTEERQNHLLEMLKWYKTAGVLINQMLLDEEVQQMEKHAKNIAASLGTTTKMLEKSAADYVIFYKTVAISEATINAALSVLKTMTSVPYPLNIPLAAAQSAAAAIQVNEIKNRKITKKYRGGMIPGMNTLIMANEQGREAILNPMAVRAIGGESGVNALNHGTYNTYNNSQSSNSTIVINTAVMTQKAYRDEIEPVLKRAEKRR